MATNPQTPNPQIPLEARQTVLDKVVAGDSFTAYEITLEVRRRLGTTVDVPHPMVNGVVQTMFAGGEIIGYGREPDKNFAVAKPPFRYFQRGGSVAAPFLAPVAPAPNRANLPVALRFTNRVAAIVRNYGLAARDSHRAAGVPDEPFAVWLPTQNDPVFRLRCYGTGFDQSEVEKRFSLDISAPLDADILWKTAFDYVDEFRVILRQNHIQTTFRAALDANLIGSVSKESEQPTSEADSVEIEIAVRPRDVDAFGRWAAQIYRYFRVAPRVHGLPNSLSLDPPKALFAGAMWRLTAEHAPLVVVGDLALVPLGSNAVRLLGGTGIELFFDEGEVNLNATREDLNYLPPTEAAIQVALERLNKELASQIEARIAAAPNLWEAKCLYRQSLVMLRSYATEFKVQAAPQIRWMGIEVENENFEAIDPAQVTVLRVEWDRNTSRLRNRRVDKIEAQENAVVFINDLNTQTGSPSRLREFFAHTPDVQMAYVLTFISNAAREKFVRDNHFETVPTRDLSSLPKLAPARRANRGRKTSTSAFNTLINRVNSLIRRVQSPKNPLVAAFETLDEADFARLKTWAREVPLDNQNWPEFKRFYKILELRLWPLQTRSRWEKSEADLPSAVLPAAREMELLGILMARMDAREARRGGVPKTPGNVGPSEDTLAYLVRRAKRLLVFLRDRDDLSAPRRAFLAPLISGLLQRENCENIAATLPFRLALDEHETLVQMPQWVANLWNDPTLAVSILHWTFEWLQKRGIEAKATPAHARRFIEVGDAEFSLQILPAILESGTAWPAEFNLNALAQALQGNSSAAAQNAAFLEKRTQIATLFARFPALQATDQWLRLSLSDATDETTLHWATPWVQRRAQEGDFKLAPLLLAPLAAVFNEALIQSRPNGLSISEWQSVLPFPLAPSLSVALQKMPLSPEAANFLWSADETSRAPWIIAIGEDKFNGALTQTLVEHALQFDFAFARGLSPAQSQIFFGAMAQAFPNGLKRETWEQLAQAVPTAEVQVLPLGEGFWAFWLNLEVGGREFWLSLLDRETAARDFAAQSTATFNLLLDKSNDNGSSEFLGAAWLDAHLGELAPDDELVLRLAQSSNVDWSRRALAHLQSRPLLLPAALRLYESELPALQQIAQPFFEADSPEWSERVLALADSPNPQARQFALTLLACSTKRWTPTLLQMLAQHDDPNVQTFVASQLLIGQIISPQISSQVAQSAAIATFDQAILNTRGRARRAKDCVQARLSNAGEMDIETLLDAARSGAPHDRAWALQQLARLALDGAEVGALKISGAVARAKRG